jgi:hypothetical protein
MNRLQREFNKVCNQYVREGYIYYFYPFPTGIMSKNVIADAMLIFKDSDRSKFNIIFIELKGTKGDYFYMNRIREIQEKFAKETPFKYYFVFAFYIKKGFTKYYLVRDISYIIGDNKIVGFKEKELNLHYIGFDNLNSLVDNVIKYG